MGLSLRQQAHLAGMSSAMYEAQYPLWTNAAETVVEGESYVAGSNISALRLITLDSNGLAQYAQPGDVPIGISTAAASTGAQVPVAVADTVLADAFWSWTVGGMIFAGVDGVLTQAPPTTDLWQAIAVALAPTRLIVRFSLTIGL